MNQKKPKRIKIMTYVGLWVQVINEFLNVCLFILTKKLDIRGVSGYELHSCVFTCLLPYSGMVPCQHALGNDPCCW